MATPLDTRPLTDAPAPGVVAAFRRAHRSDPAFGGSSPVGYWIVIAIGVVFVLAGIFVIRMGWLPIAIGAVAAVAALALLVTGGGGWTKRYRLFEFAARNGLTWSATTDGPAYPGAIFGHGSGRFVQDRFRRIEGRALDYGNYQYTTGSGKNRQTHHWWFLAMRLDRVLPHMVLDSRANNALFGATNLPVAFSRDQILSLEGDFDRHFTLYAPKQYERDALYVFTPDLMALCIDEAGAWDLEIVDDWLFAYSNRSVDMAEPAIHARVWRFVDTVGAKTLDRTDHYADENVGPRPVALAANIVAPQGARLKRGAPVAAIVTTVVVIAVFVGLRFLNVF